MEIWRSICRSMCSSHSNRSKPDYKSLDLLRSLSGILSAAILVCTASGAIAEDDAPGPKLVLGQGQPIWNERDRAQAQLPIWPDMPLGALKTRSDEYLWFGPGSRGTRETEGTYVLRGSLDSFQPYNVNGKGIPQLSMHMGSIQPSPDGNDFDRDYAGGGPAYCVTPQGDLTGECEEHAPIIVVYHGELHFFGHEKGQFGGTGLAVSRNGGRTFAKLGAILLAHASREECRERHLNAYADGSLFEGDEEGRPIEDESRDKKASSEVYWYSVFSDPQALNKRWGFGIARVKRSEALAALKQNRSPEFRKYYDGKWTESGLGGMSTPVVIEPDHYIATPQVHYSHHLKKYVLIYQQDQNSAWLRTASNALQWSQPVLLHRVAGEGQASGAEGKAERGAGPGAMPAGVGRAGRGAMPVVARRAGTGAMPAGAGRAGQGAMPGLAQGAVAKRKLFYPSIVGDGKDPNDIGHRFNFYCVTGPVSDNMNVWKHGILLRKVVNFEE